jgi:hypothetical protein
MNKTVVFIAGSMVLVFMLLHTTGCKVNLSNPPIVIIDTIAGYVYDDTTIAQNTTFSVYITALRDGNNDLLETGSISHSVNGGPDSVIQKMTFASTQFFQYYSYVTGKAGNTERFKFTFGNENGQTSSASITIKDTI